MADDAYERANLTSDATAVTYEKLDGRLIERSRLLQHATWLRVTSELNTCEVQPR